MKSEKNKEKKQDKIKYKRPKSLTIMLWRNYCLFLFLIILVIGLFTYIIVESTISASIQIKMIDAGADLSEWLKGDFSEDELTEFINGESFLNGIDIIVLTDDGNILLPNDISEIEKGYWSGVESSIYEKLSSSDISNVFFRYESDNDSSYIYALKARYSDAEGGVYIVVSYALATMSGAINSVQSYFIIAGVILIVTAFLISYGLSQKISDPLKRLTATANKMAKGDYTVKFASTEYQEIAQLSDTLNYAKDEIKKTDEFQKELLANVSHDLKTPLTMIKAYASMIQEISGDNPEKRNQHLQVIIDESDRLTGLVNDLLNVSKIRSDVDQINKKVFNLTEFLFGIMKKFEYLQDTQGYQFYADIDADLYTFADEEKIGQVLYNLISNAVNYTGQDKKVYISLKLDMPENRIKFSVRDTGKGIKKEDIPSIWDRYYRAKEQHARPVKGTGLGLSIVKTILEKHSFNFGVESEVGKGSTFWVDFPEVDASVPT
ncbi:MAG: HAMP domain-containing histidine kinase [Clostridia bacterium]|nr:HAMP domain-containing histidine kinase [Clostridia bacterium]